MERSRQAQPRGASVSQLTEHQKKKRWKRKMSRKQGGGCGLGKGKQGKENSQKLGRTQKESKQGELETTSRVSLRPAWEKGSVPQGAGDGATALLTGQLGEDLPSWCRAVQGSSFSPAFCTNRDCSGSSPPVTPSRPPRGMRGSPAPLHQHHFVVLLSTSDP